MCAKVRETRPNVKKWCLLSYSVPVNKKLEVRTLVFSVSTKVASSASSAGFCRLLPVLQWCQFCLFCQHCGFCWFCRFSRFCRFCRFCRFSAARRHRPHTQHTHTRPQPHGHTQNRTHCHIRQGQFCSRRGLFRTFGKVSGNTDCFREVTLAHGKVNSVAKEDFSELLGRAKGTPNCCWKLDCNN